MSGCWCGAAQEAPRAAAPKRVSRGSHHVAAGNSTPFSRPASTIGGDTQCFHVSLLGTQVATVTKPGLFILLVAIVVVLLLSLVHVGGTSLSFLRPLLWCASGVLAGSVALQSVGGASHAAVTAREAGVDDSASVVSAASTVFKGATRLACMGGDSCVHRAHRVAAAGVKRLDTQAEASKNTRSSTQNPEWRTLRPEETIWTGMALNLMSTVKSTVAMVMHHVLATRCIQVATPTPSAALPRLLRAPVPALRVTQLMLMPVPVLALVLVLVLVLARRS